MSNRSVPFAQSLQSIERILRRFSSDISDSETRDLQRNKALINLQVPVERVLATNTCHDSAFYLSGLIFFLRAVYRNAKAKNSLPQINQEPINLLGQTVYKVVIIVTQKQTSANYSVIRSRIHMSADNSHSIYICWKRSSHSDCVWKCSNHYCAVEVWWSKRTLPRFRRLPQHSG